jgi:citrate lyase subunit beta/citryl-CoA lyase
LSLLRTWLFAPANNAGRVEKALAAGADVVILDLEDACPEAEKAAARVAAQELLRRERSCQAYVRVNGAGTGHMEADLQAVVGEGLDGIILSKAERPAEVLEADRIIGLLEHRRGLPEGVIQIVPLIETAVGLSNLRAIACASERMRRLAFGAVDLALDLGLRPGPDELELLPFRAAIALASKVEGLEPPVDAAWLAIADGEGMARAAERARSMGFQGKLCIHPRQLDAVRTAFTPTPEEIARAERIVQAFAMAEAQGSAAVTVDGAFVDYPIARQAERLLASLERRTV